MNRVRKLTDKEINFYVDNMEMFDYGDNVRPIVKDILHEQDKAVMRELLKGSTTLDSEV